MSDYWTFRTWTTEHEELIARASEQRLAREARRARRAARAAARAAAGRPVTAPETTPVTEPEPSVQQQEKVPAHV